MTLRFVTISELPEFTFSNEYSEWKDVPISPARAFSQAKNPNAQPNDIALILAIDDETGNVLSYAGIFPSKLNDPDSTRFAWNSCWWAAEGAGGDVALKVFLNFLKLWDNKVAFSDLTKKTFKIVQGLGFCQTMERDGIVLNLRPGLVSRLKVLSYSNRKFKLFVKPIIYTGIPWLTDQFANLLLYLPQRFQNSVSVISKPVVLAFPEERDFLFIQRIGAGDFHIPGKDELRMPLWLGKQVKSNRFLAENYYFSSFANQFSTFWLRWEKNDVTNALLMVSLRDGVLKTLYTYCEEDYKTKLPPEFLGYCFTNSSINTVITAQPILTAHILKRKIFILSRKQFTRYSAVSKELLKFSGKDPILQDGDGDYRFT